MESMRKGRLEYSEDEIMLTKHLTIYLKFRMNGSMKSRKVSLNRESILDYANYSIDYRPTTLSGFTKEEKKTRAGRRKGDRTNAAALFAK